NNAEQLAYGTEKLITDNAEKLPDDVKTDVQADIDALKTALAGDDDDAVKTAFDKLNESQGRIGEARYQQSQTPQPTAADSGTGGPAEGGDEGIVDPDLLDDQPEQQ